MDFDHRNRLSGMEPPELQQSLKELDDTLRQRHERLEVSLRSFMDRHELQMQQLLSFFDFPTKSQASYTKAPSWTDAEMLASSEGDTGETDEQAVEEEAGVAVEATASATSSVSIGEGRKHFRLAKSRTTHMAVALQNMQAEQRKQWREQVKKFLGSGLTELCVAALTLLSAVVVGIQVEEVAQNVHDPSAKPSIVFALINHALTLCFTSELLLRIYAFRKEFLCSEEWHWNLLDTVIVSASLLEFFLDLMAWASEDGAGLRSADLSMIKAMRVVRILRLVRVFRVVRFFRSLRVLIASIMHTLRSVVWALMLLTMIMYTFAILFTFCYSDFVTNPPARIPPEQKLQVEDQLRRYFGSVPASMLFLFAAISDGISWTNMSTPLFQAGWVWLALFIGYIALVIFAVLNVVTGVFCQNAIESASLDQEMVIEAQLKSKKMYTDQVRTLFNLMDEGNCGELTAHVFEEYINEPQVAAYFRALDMDLNNAWKLFTLLDPDGSGTIDLNEFVEGCLKLRGPATRLDMEMVLSVARSTAKRQNQLASKLEELEQQLKGAAKIGRVQPGGARDATFKC